MPLISLLRALHFGATCALGGAVAFDLLVLGRGDRALAGAAAPGLRRSLRRLAAASIVVGLLTWCGWLALVAIGMSGLPPAQALTADVVRTLVTRTTFGHVWAARTALFVLAAACLPALSPPRRLGVRTATLAIACAALAGSLAASGHALAGNRVHLWVDAAHLVGATLWIGMLPPLLHVVRTATAGAPTGSLRLAADALRRFTPPAMLAVAILAVTGVANAWWLVGSAAGLVGTPYGTLLLAKVALFAIMLLLALANRLRWTPRLDDGAAASADRRLALRRLRRNVVAELLLGAAVLALVGVLGVSAPPAHEAPMQQASGTQLGGPGAGPHTETGCL